MSEARHTTRSPTSPEPDLPTHFTSQPVRECPVWLLVTTISCSVTLPLSTLYLTNISLVSGLITNISEINNPFRLPLTTLLTFLQIFLKFLGLGLNHQNLRINTLVPLRLESHEQYIITLQIFHKSLCFYHQKRKT